ncbi:D-sedoheptulose 7-phosphate isomerase [Flagellimonas sp. 389]|uniref:D-sedoheptulose 7-phosphate isomerase n=1 Tax=Flagellimonas sp. 389 TaxID=2835862 RepID=UPI001BD42958|nr:D-sedoheptulose 7-phosphate isomerase [Flagellimonas sp. 389]MBS9462573.1 D-sedoheptulose 7-phosphate isomerase [Flagellimonas sp. 389]
MEHLQRNIKKEFIQARNVLDDFITVDSNFGTILEISKQMTEAFNRGNKVISCGNGGSHCDAMHFAEELTGRYRENRTPLPAIAISDPSHLSCISNDYGYEYVFSRFVESIGASGDILLGISTSGNSQSIVQAFKTAQTKGMTTILLSGKSGGKLKQLSDISLLVPYEGYADRIQEIHIKIIHSVIFSIEKMMNL